jgi:hypothetical protein
LVRTNAFRLLCTLWVAIVLTTSLYRAPASAAPVPPEMVIKVGEYVLESAHFAFEGYHAYEVYRKWQDGLSSSRRANASSRPSSQDLNFAAICYTVGRCGVNKDLPIARQLFSAAAASRYSFAENNLAILCILSPTGTLPWEKKSDFNAFVTCLNYIAQAGRDAESTHDGVAMYNFGVAALKGEESIDAAEYLLRAIDFNYAGARNPARTACRRVAVEYNPSSLEAKRMWLFAHRVEQTLSVCRHYKLLS